MATTKREFMQMYDQAVTLLKQYKHQNDTLNKSIGLEHSSSLSIKIRAEQSNLQQLIKRLDQILILLQQSYLDPQTARRIGTIKQQYKIQKDRRQHIIKQIQQLANDHIMHKQTSQKQSYPNYQLPNTKYTITKSSNNHNRRHDNSKDQQINEHTRTTLTQEQITQYDYEIECKLLQQRNKSLEESQKRMRNVYNIAKQTKQMVEFQGEHLDIISDQIFKAKENVHDALKEIKQANQFSRKRRNKVVAGVSFILLIVAIIIICLVFL